MNTTIRSYLWTICWHQTVHFLKLLPLPGRIFLGIKSESNQGAPLSNLRVVQREVFDDGMTKKNFAEKTANARKPN